MISSLIARSWRSRSLHPEWLEGSGWVQIEERKMTKSWRKKNTFSRTGKLGKTRVFEYFKGFSLIYLQHCMPFQGRKKLVYLEKLSNDFFSAALLKTCSLHRVSLTPGRCGFLLRFAPDIQETLDNFHLHQTQRWESKTKFEPTKTVTSHTNPLSWSASPQNRKIKKIKKSQVQGLPATLYDSCLLAWAGVAVFAFDLGVGFTLRKCCSFALKTPSWWHGYLPFSLRPEMRPRRPLRCSSRPWAPKEMIHSTRTKWSPMEKYNHRPNLLWDGPCLFHKKRWEASFESS